VGRAGEVGRYRGSPGLPCFRGKPLPPATTAYHASVNAAPPNALAIESMRPHTINSRPLALAYACISAMKLR
jgi:hypothetical protein